jgi:hypothetical protein
MNWVITDLGLVKASYRLEPYVLFKAYACKALHDPLLRGTLPNALRYLTRLTRGSY